MATITKEGVKKIDNFRKKLYIAGEISGYLEDFASYIGISDPTPANIARTRKISQATIDKFLEKGLDLKPYIEFKIGRATK